MGEAVAMLEKKLGSETAQRIVNQGDALFADQELNTSNPHQPRKVLGMWI
jgi:hypothetical protein